MTKRHDFQQQHRQLERQRRAAYFAQGDSVADPGEVAASPGEPAATRPDGEPAFDPSCEPRLDV